LALNNFLLQLLACIEIVENQSYYEPTNAACHPLLSRYDIVGPFVHELEVRDSLCWNALLLGALIALSYVLEVFIQSYYPPISCAFLSPLTVNINGRSNSSAFMYYSISNSMPWDFGKLVVCIISTKSFIFILRCIMFIAYTQKPT